MAFNLVYTELHLTLWRFFRRYDELDLSGVTSGDLEWDHLVVPVTRGKLMVRVKESKM